MTESTLRSYLKSLAHVSTATEATGANGRPMPIDEAVAWAVTRARAVHADGNKLMFIGNGGSAAIASHLAIDFSKNGGLRATAFNDGAALTCLGNDLGYENVFAHQVALHGRPGDLLVAISSSGRSANILNGVDAARRAGAEVLTLSGFEPDNPLRGMGAVNLYAPSTEYGFVEISHLTLGHAILDLAMGWTEASAGTGATAVTEADVTSCDPNSKRKEPTMTVNVMAWGIALLGSGLVVSIAFGNGYKQAATIDDDNQINPGVVKVLLPSTTASGVVPNMTGGPAISIQAPTPQSPAMLHPSRHTQLWIECPARPKIIDQQTCRSPDEEPEH